MTAAPFLVGFVMGAAFVACAFVLFFTRKPAARQPAVWTEETYHPPVTTRLLIKERNFEI